MGVYVHLARCNAQEGVRAVSSGGMDSLMAMKRACTKLSKEDGSVGSGDEASPAGNWRGP